MRRADLDALQTWARHDDPLFAQYNVRALTRAEADDLWRHLAGAPGVRRPFSGLVDGRLTASLMLRDIDRANGCGDVGIVLDPQHVGRGLGRRILQAFAAVLASDGFRRLTLEVAGFNGRAIAAYRAAGFPPAGERWGEAEPALDIAALLEGPAATRLRPHVRAEPGGAYVTRIIWMERRLDPPTERQTPLS